MSPYVMDHVYAWFAILLILLIALFCVFHPYTSLAIYCFLSIMHSLMFLYLISTVTGFAADTSCRNKSMSCVSSALQLPLPFLTTLLVSGSLLVFRRPILVGKSSISHLKEMTLSTMGSSFSVLHSCRTHICTFAT